MIRTRDLPQVKASEIPVFAKRMLLPTELNPLLVDFITAISRVCRKPANDDNLSMKRNQISRCFASLHL